MRLRQSYEISPEPREYIDERDHGREIEEAYYDCAVAMADDEVNDPEGIGQTLRALIKQAPDFLGPYLLLGELLKREGREVEASALFRAAAERAVAELEDEAGKLPSILEWGWLGNRHIMRALNTYAGEAWQAGETEEALAISQYLLRACPNDNLGVRYVILAILEGMSHDKFMRDFQKLAGSDWFRTGAAKHPEQLGWLLEAWAAEGD